MNPTYRRALLGIALAIVVLGAVPAAVFAAQPSCGDTLTVNTTLTANLNCSGYSGDALTMGANEIVLNLNGKTITGPAGNDGYSGVGTNGYNRTVIRNGTVRDYTYGVSVEDSNRTTVAFLTLDGEDASNAYGIYHQYGVYNVFHHITAVDAYDGIYTEYAANTTIRDSNLTGGWAGIESQYSTKNTMSNNVVHGDEYGVYDYRSHRNTYVGNTASNGGYGFYLDCQGYGQVTMNGNTATNNDDTGFYADECYVVDHIVDQFIGSRFVNNRSTFNDYGFDSENSYNELWRGNFAADNDSDGFYWSGPGGTRIVSNTSLRNDSEGFYLAGNYPDSNVDFISFNTARANDSFGFYAENGTVGEDNVSTNNGSKCYNVDC